MLKFLLKNLKFVHVTGTFPQTYGAFNTHRTTVPRRARSSDDAQKRADAGIPEWACEYPRFRRHQDARLVTLPNCRPKYALVAVL